MTSDPRSGGTRKRKDVMADPAVAALVHKGKRDIAERLYNLASNNAEAWRTVALELAEENAKLRQSLAVASVAAALTSHLDAKENPFADEESR